jgi:hypothetical protein
MGSKQVEESEYQAWRSLVKSSFEACRSKLEEADGALAARLLIRCAGARRGEGGTVLLGNPAYVCAAAIEDLDCKVASGFFLVSGGRGRETRRALDPAEFTPAEWEGTEEFHALYRRILRRHSVRELLDRFPAFAKAEQVDTAAPDEDHSAVEEVTRYLALFAELLLTRGQKAAAETAMTIITCISREGGASGLWNTSHSGFWESLGAEMGLKTAALYKRKQRFLALLIGYSDELPGWLAERARRILAVEAADSVADCRRLAKAVPVEIQGLVEALEMYLLWALAESNPQCRGWDLTRIAGESAASLTGGVRQSCVRQWPPAGAGFARFCARFGFVGCASGQAVAALRGSLAGLQPRPARILALLDSMFPGGGTGQGGEEPE